MIWNELSETLTELARAVVPSNRFGLVVTEASVEVPLEMRTSTIDGRVVILAQPAHTRWKSGFLPPTNMTKMHLVEVTDSGR
jgi:hypothetical protein